MSTEAGIEHLFSSHESLSRTFSQGLSKMLEDRVNLGNFILVLANVYADKSAFSELQQPLLHRFHELQTSIAEQPELLQGGEDDVAVFQQLSQNYDQFAQPPQSRYLGPWQLNLNLLRGLRPPRAQKKPSEQLLTPFNPDGFHFNKPQLDKEALFIGQYHETSVKLLYNKFPFMPLHALWVPDAEENQPQYLTEQVHQQTWTMLQQFSSQVKGLGIGYNSLGAGASVNHLHLQMFASSMKLPVELQLWQHNKGTVPYPLSCNRFNDLSNAWNAIQALHQANIPYNLLYRPDHLYLISRKRLGSFQPAAWLPAPGWSEVAGKLVVFGLDNFNQLIQTDIYQTLTNLRI